VGTRFPTPPVHPTYKNSVIPNNNNNNNNNTEYACSSSVSRANAYLNYYQSLFQTIRNAMARNARALYTHYIIIIIIIVISLLLNLCTYERAAAATCARRKVDAESLTLAFLRLVTVKMSGTKTPLGKRRRRIKDGGGGGKTSSFRRVVLRNCPCHRRWNFSADAHNRVFVFSSTLRGRVCRR